MPGGGSPGCWRRRRWSGGLPRRRRLPEKLLIEYELLPELPYGIEARFLRGRRYVLNFDDDVWIKYEGRGRLADKYDRLVAGACGVVCANDLLLEKVLKLNPDAVKIPTAVDLDAFPLQAGEVPALHGRLDRSARSLTPIWSGMPRHCGRCPARRSSSCSS